MKIAFIVTDGSESIQVIVPHDILVRAQNDVDLISLNDKDKVTLSNNSPTLVVDRKFRNVNDWDKYDAIILPGGIAGQKQFLVSLPLKEKVVEFRDKNKLVAAICASSGVLGAYGLLDGLKATVYPGFGNTNNVNWVNDRVVVEGNIITSKAPGTALEFGLAIVEKLNGREMAIALQEGMFIKA